MSRFLESPVARANGEIRRCQREEPMARDDLRSLYAMYRSPERSRRMRVFLLVLAAASFLVVCATAALLWHCMLAGVQREQAGLAMVLAMLWAVSAVWSIAFLHDRIIKLDRKP